MLSVVLFLIAVAATFIHLNYNRQWGWPKASEVFLSYFLPFVVGGVSLLAAYAHVFMGPETARQIGWQPGSPFQYEMGMANLSYGVLGVLSYWIRGRFWDATLIGWSILLFGCFVGHAIDYYAYGNNAPLNFGLFVWFYDLFSPLVGLSTLAYLRSKKNA